MKNLFNAAFFCSAIFLMTQCSKNEGLEFSPIGFWRGNAFVSHTGILNNPNGTSRIYYRIPGADTAHAQLIQDGTYTMTNGCFKAKYPYNNTDTLFIESTSASANALSGLWSSR